ncbi:metalloprotein [Pasteurellaceae bacterium RH1A]|nr:metalloprotein [Pasteurellaceae bacterium RH1A]
MILKNAKFYEDLTACFGDLSQFEGKIRELAQVARIDLSQFEIDHLAVRMNDEQTAQAWQSLLLQGASLLKESQVNGRPIGLFSLHQPLVFLGQEVSIIELPFPKGKIYNEQGWEHIEIVFPMLDQESIEQWTARTLAHFNLQAKPLKIKVSQVKVEGERLPNPSIAISLGTNLNSVCLKLHPYPIQTIIRSEMV